MICSAPIFPKSILIVDDFIILFTPRTDPVIKDRTIKLVHRGGERYTPIRQWGL